MPDPIRKIALSRHAAQLLAAHPELAAEADCARAPFSRAEMEQALHGALGDEEAAFKRRLRRLRQRVLLRTMARDLDGSDMQDPGDAMRGLGEVCAAMSELADLSIRTAMQWLREEQLIVVAMGKLGGRELNVSSDIDLVFVHPDSKAYPADATQLARTGRKLISLLSDITEDGFVFRVDMRLRPYGESGALVSGFEALEAYFVAQGREWERYAWTKARPVSGAMHAEVRRDVERRELADHVKLGPGGIREIEFIAQALQLVRGGRDAELTQQPTLTVLDLLARKRHLPEKTAHDLKAAYVFLRHVEHRLQYLDDAQLHELPGGSDDRSRVAQMAGFAGWDAFAAALNAHRAAVTRHFQEV